jgi:5-hydroxytryptamine receptor 2
VLLKIMFVWAVSVAISSPICIYGFTDTTTVFKDGLCAPTMTEFVIYGSVFACYIPLLIMVITWY